MSYFSPLFWVLSISILTAVFGFIPLLGIPGAIWIEIYLKIAGIFGYSLDLLKIGPGAWVLAIWVTWLWPIGIILGYGATYLTNVSTRKNIIIWIIVTSLWALLVCYGVIKVMV
jgi:hypothetical protein